MGGRILDLCREVAREHEALSNEYRVLILALLLDMGRASWTELKRRMERILGYQLNPNFLAFHIRRLVTAGLVRREEAGREVVYTPSIPEEYKQVLERVLREVGGSGYRG